MTARLRLRDALSRVLPWWLSDRHEQGKSTGYRFLWAQVAVLDTFLDALLEGMQASWPGAGTPTALPYIGRSRGVIRGRGDTDDEYAAKCRAWLDRSELWGSMLGIASEFQDYLANHPRVRVINRGGRWLTLNADKTVDIVDAAWDWDSVSNPERATWFSDLWVVLYTDEYPTTGEWGDGRDWGARDSGIGLLAPRTERDEMAHLVAEVKSAGSRIRAVIWCADETLFDPSAPATCPDGTWGQWSLPGSDPRVPGGRDRTCRYWEPQ